MVENWRGSRRHQSPFQAADGQDSSAAPACSPRPGTRVPHPRRCALRQRPTGREDDAARLIPYAGSPLFRNTPDIYRRHPLLSGRVFFLRDRCLLSIRCRRRATKVCFPWKGTRRCVPSRLQLMRLAAIGGGTCSGPLPSRSFLRYPLPAYPRQPGPGTIQSACKDKYKCRQIGILR